MSQTCVLRAWARGVVKQCSLAPRVGKAPPPSVAKAKGRTTAGQGEWPSPGGGGRPSTVWRRCYHTLCTRSPRTTRTSVSTCSVIDRGSQSSQQRLSSGYVYFQGSGPRSWIRQSRIRYWLLILFGSAGLYYVSHLSVVEETGRVRFISLSPEAERKYGDAAVTQVLSTFGRELLPPQHSLSRKVREIGFELLRESGLEREKEWKFFVVDRRIPNALSLPNGEVFIFTGMIKVAQDRDGVAAVLSHEIAHVLARHFAERCSKLQISRALLLVFSIFTDFPIFSASSLFKYGVELPGSRKQEIEADLIGLKLMSKACYRPQAAARLWRDMDRLDRQSGRGNRASFMGTHPTHQDRFEKIIEYLPKAEGLREDSGCEQAQRFWGFRG